MHAQEFESAWPAVLDEMLEFVLLTHLSLGHNRMGLVRVTLPRSRVAATELQPHANGFRAKLKAQLPAMRLELKARQQDAFRVELHYAS